MPSWVSLEDMIFKMSPEFSLNGLITHGKVGPYLIELWVDGRADDKP